MWPRNPLFVPVLSASIPGIVSGGQLFGTMDPGYNQRQAYGYIQRGPDPNIMHRRIVERVRAPPNYPYKKLFRVMSYNVLSDTLLYEHLDLYGSCHPQALPFDNRKMRIIHEIISHRPAIVCLQEVDAKHFESFYLQELSKHGYHGEFVQRTDNVDGVAIFYKTDEFKLLEWKPVQYFVSYKEILNRGNVGIVMALQPIDHKELRLPTRICVANTHLLFNMKRGDVKLAQLAYLLANLHELAQKPGQPLGTYYPSILCGDLNSTLNSDICKFITSGFINYTNRDRISMSGQMVNPSRTATVIPCNILPSFISHQCTLRSNSTNDTPVEASNNHTAGASGNGITKRTRNPSSPDSKASKSQRSKSSHSDLLAFPDDVAALCDELEVSDSRQSPEVGSTACTPRPSMSLPSEAVQPSANASVAARSDQEEPWGKLTHRFKFCQSYRHCIARYQPMNVPGATTIHSGNAGLTVDHIFYAGSRSYNGRYNLTLVSRYGLLSAEELEHAGFIPNMFAPSDHLPIVAEFCLTK